MGVGEPALAVRGVTSRYGRAVAIRNVSLDVYAGEVVALLGANGSGKTTLLNTVSGFLTPVEGTITTDGTPITGLPPHRIFRHGVVQVSQGRDLFADMSVLDNLRLGAAVRKGGVADDLERVFTYFPRLAERRAQRARTLSGGEQQMLAIGRALMGRPRILLLDEPSGGLAPRFVDEIGRIMHLLKTENTTMLLVEQNIALAMSVADRFYIMRAGDIVVSGRTAELATSYTDLAQTYYL